MGERERERERHFFQFHFQIIMASAWECPFGSHSYLVEVLIELEKVVATVVVYNIMVVLVA